MSIPIHHKKSKTGLLALVLLLALAVLLLFFINPFMDSSRQPVIGMETDSFFISMLCI
jgi:hypothetical protein